MNAESRTRLNQTPEWTALAEHRERLGPSLAEGSVPFHDHFGDDEALLRMSAAALEGLR